ETGTYVKTHWFTFFFIPVFALGAYRVANAPSGGWYFIGREPLSGGAKAWNLCLVCLLFVGGGLIWWNAHTGSAEYKARRKVEEADGLAEAGELDRAASLYREVASGTTEHAVPAATKFKALLKEPLDKAPAKMVAGVLRVAVSWQPRPDVQEGLAQRGLDLARTKGEDEPQDALAILDVIERLQQKREDYLKIRRALLEKVVAKSPDDLERIVQLAVVCEAQDDLRHCEKLLTQHAGRLGSTEGARILGRILAHQGKTEEAYRLLRPYADENLKHFHEAEKALQDAFVAARTAIIDRVNNRLADDFPYDQHRQASETERAAIEN